MSEKYFTFDEAQTLLPVLESLLRTAVDSKQTIETVDSEFDDLRQRIFMNGGTSVDIVTLGGGRAPQQKNLARAQKKQPSL
jgi:hypothetical protein